MLTYKEWILKFVDVNLPIGDIAKDIAMDESFPNSKERDVLLEYLESKNASELFLKVFERSYRFYREDVSF